MALDFSKNIEASFDTKKIANLLADEGNALGGSGNRFNIRYSQTKECSSHFSKGC